MTDQGMNEVRARFDCVATEWDTRPTRVVFARVTAMDTSSEMKLSLAGATAPARA